jgi:FkbM family methyltransferase
MKNFIKRHAPSRMLHGLRLHNQITFGRGEKELKFIPSLCSEFDISIDVGANIGIYSTVLSKISNEVHCFEPSVKLCKYLNTVLPKNCTVHNVALSNFEGSATLRVPMSEDRSEIYGLATIEESNPLEAYEDDMIGKIDVPVVEFDRHYEGLNLTDRKLDFMKIDVEGYEEKVILGAENTINKYRPIIMLETELRHNKNCFNLFEIFNAWEYRPAVLESNGLADTNAEVFFDLQKRQGAESPDYVNNVFFLPIERHEDIVAKRY